MNLASILRGPVIANWRGVTSFHKGGLELPTSISTFDIEAEPWGLLQSRKDTPDMKITLTPAGRVQEVVSMINRYSTTENGELLNIEEYPVTINASTDTLTTATAHLLSAGDEVMVHATLTQPGGVNRTTRYYANVPTGTTLKLYDTEAHAIAGGSTGLVDITDAGSGVILDVCRPLTITTLKGWQAKFYNVGLTKVPDLIFGATKTMLGQAEFTIYVRNGQDPDDPSNGYFALSQVTPPTPSIDPADIKTRSPKITWEEAAVWSNLLTRAGATVSFDLRSPQGIESDAFGDGAMGAIFKGIVPSVKATPYGPTESELLSALKLHSKSRGESIGGGALTVATATHQFVIGDAALITGPQMFSTQDPRIGECEWRGQRTVTEGVVDAPFELTEL